MAKFKPWLKLWVEWIHDPKMFSLTWAEKGMWCGVLTLAQQCAADGSLIKGNGSPLTISEIANCLHITSAKDRKTLEGMISKMAGAGSLHWNSNLLVVTHFAERQAKIASETPEAIRDRVRRHRESRSVTDNPLHPLTPEALAKEIRTTLMALPETIDYLVEHEIIKDTLAKLAQGRGLVPKSEVTTDTGRIDLLWKEPTGKVVAAFEIDVYEPKKRSLTKLNSLDCPYAFVILRTNPQPLRWEGNILLIGLSKEKESSKEKDIKEGEGEAEVECNGKKPVTAEAILAEIVKNYGENFAIITPILSEKFKDFAENYRGPVEWIKDAFAEAVTHNVRKWAYVEAILDRWQQEGREKHGRGISPGRGAPAHKQDPHAAAKAAGWKVGGEEEKDGARDQD